MMPSFDAFCLVEIARIREALDLLEQRILRRRSRIDAKNERWFWLKFMAACEVEESIETQYIEAIAPDGTTTTKRIRPRWYWRQRGEMKRQKPEYRERERLRSKLKRQRAKERRTTDGT